MINSILNRFSIDPSLSTARVLEYVDACHEQVMNNSFENIVRIRERFGDMITDEFAEQFIEGSGIAMDAIDNHFRLSLEGKKTIKASELFRILNESFDGVALDLNQSIVKSKMNDEPVAELLDADDEMVKAIELGGHLGQTVVMLTITTFIVQTLFSN